MDFRGKANGRKQDSSNRKYLVRKTLWTQWRALCVCCGWNQPSHLWKFSNWTIPSKCSRSIVYLIFATHFVRKRGVHQFYGIYWAIAFVERTINQGDFLIKICEYSAKSMKIAVQRWTKAKKTAFLITVWIGFNIEDMCCFTAF